MAHMGTTEAIQKLRQLDGTSRQVFATYLGISMTAVQNYEQGRKPDPRCLLALLRKANDMNQHDLAEVFRRELRASLGADPAKRITI